MHGFQWGMPMTTLSTTDGLMFLFSPAAVTLVADRDLNSGEAGTTVYGLQSGQLRIAESVDAFLSRIGLAAAFATLTRPDGSRVRVNAKLVRVVRQPVEGEYGPAVRSVLFIGESKQGVIEDLTECGQAIRQHGGPL